jgi:hypothetical protein
LAIWIKADFTLGISFGVSLRIGFVLPERLTSRRRRIDALSKMFNFILLSKIERCTPIADFHLAAPTSSTLIIRGALLVKKTYPANVAFELKAKRY